MVVEDGDAGVGNDGAGGKLGEFVVGDGEGVWEDELMVAGLGEVWEDELTVGEWAKGALRE